MQIVMKEQLLDVLQSEPGHREIEALRITGTDLEMGAGLRNEAGTKTDISVCRT